MKKAKILVIEDEFNRREAIVYFLERNGGYKVFQANDGEEGERMFLIHSPDIVIIDLSIPGKRAEEVMRFIKKDPQKKTMVIAMSGNQQLEAVARAAGCDEFLIKPIHLLTLQDVVKKILNRG